MPDRRTQSYAALPSTGSEFVRTPGHVCIPVWFAVETAVHRCPALVRANTDPRVYPAVLDPEDFEPELPPSPTFWPRDEPKEPQR